MAKKKVKAKAKASGAGMPADLAPMAARGRDALARFLPFLKDVAEGRVEPAQWDGWWDANRAKVAAAGPPHVHAGIETAVTMSRDPAARLADVQEIVSQVLAVLGVPFTPTVWYP